LAANWRNDAVDQRAQHGLDSLRLSDDMPPAWHYLSVSPRRESVRFVADHAQPELPGGLGTEKQVMTPGRQRTRGLRRLIEGLTRSSDLG
jgi:hypothetical protein